MSARLQSLRPLQPFRRPNPYRRLRSLAVALAVVAACIAAVPSAAVAQERILDYDVEVAVHADGAIDVTEHISVRAVGRQIRRGIYRDFPTRYRDRYGNNIVVDFEVVDVQRDGEAEDWFTEGQLNGVRVNTGGDDYLPELPGQYRFTLRYRTHRQIGFFETHDELYWNAIGTGWVFPIEQATVTVALPEPVPADQLELEGYSGPQGAQEQAFSTQVVEPGIARWTLTSPLGPREGLTIVLSFPKGLVAEPTRVERSFNLLNDNRGVLVALAGLIALLTFTIGRWRRVGRDPEPGVIIPRYAPPNDRSPAELRFLRRRSYDARCFTSDLLHAAVQGRVRIEQEPRMLLSDKWRLHLADSAATSAPATSAAPSAATSGATSAATSERETYGALLRKLFEKGSPLELKKSNATTLQGAWHTHSKVLKARLDRSHFNYNAGSAVIAFVIAVVAAVLALVVSGGGGVPLIIMIGGLMLIIVLVFVFLVQAPTPAGRQLLDEIEGLKLYLAVAERDELASLEGPAGEPPLDAQRYEMLLPYAVALDVEEAWTKKFTLAAGAAAVAAATAHIAWYRGGGIQNLTGLVTAVGSELNSSIASASTPPGSSSGRGGGGFSGGGGGGGGGGGR